MKESRDILTLFEQLNSHEVFTPPRVARDMLALIPKEIWSDPSVRILDPCVKSGVFLREAMYLLIDGLAGKGKHIGHDGVEYDLNDGKQRMNHILKNMLFGIATSELTSYVSRRTLYGVMEANTDKQTALIEAFEKSKNNKQWTEEEKVNFLVRNHFNEYYDHGLFNTPEYAGFEHEGNIFYPRNEVNKQVDDSGSFIIEDTYYPFIEERVSHEKIQQIKDGQMKFDVVIGNPPYQVSDGGGHGDSSKPIYHHFINKAKKINPRFMSFIVPSRWMKGGKGLDSFRDSMIADCRIEKMIDHQDAGEVFPNVHIDGGVCYFLWNNNHNGELLYTFKAKDGYVGETVRSLESDFSTTIIRDDRFKAIIEKAAGGECFSEIVLPRNPFGIFADVFNAPEKYEKYKTKAVQSSVEVHGVIGKKGGAKRKSSSFDESVILKNKEYADRFNIFFSKAFSTGAVNPPKHILSKPRVVCSETFLCIGGFENQEQQLSCESYMKTKFFKALLYFNRSSINVTKSSFEYIPIVEFNKQWNDEELFKMFHLTSDEIDFIKGLFQG